MKRLAVAMALAAALLAGCARANPAEPPSTVTPLNAPIVTPEGMPTEVPPADLKLTAELLARVQAAEQAWQNSQIASYRMTLLEIHSIWSAQRLTITVTDGHVADIQIMCIPAPAQGSTCTIKPVEPSNYLVPTLLAMAHEMAELRNPNHIRLSFDPALGYPTTIGYDDPQILDEDYGLTVEAFERLPGRPASELGKLLKLRVGETGQAEGLTIEVVRIVEDSRCPRNVDCAWSGQVVVELSVIAPNVAPELIQFTMIGTSMRPEAAVQIAGDWRVWLTSVTPYPIYDPAGGASIPVESYGITLQVSKAYPLPPA